jgi:hypothetical protein
MVVAAAAVGVLDAAGGDRAEQLLAVQLLAVVPVGETVLEHQVLPFLENRRGRIPEQRKHEDDDVVLAQPALFTVDIDAVIRVLGIQVDDGNGLLPARGVEQRPVDLGAVLRWVREQDQDAGGHGSGPDRK